MYWSSNQDGSWSICSSILNTNQNKWDSAVKISKGPYNQKNPFIIPDQNKHKLGYRSNEHMVRKSEIYNYEDYDFSPAGSTTLVANNSLKIGLINQYEDFTSYTYDTGKSNNNKFARDTVGIYLKTGYAGSMDQNTRLKKMLHNFIPVNTRLVISSEEQITEEIIGNISDFYIDKVSRIP